MGEFVNGWKMKVMSSALGVIVIAINIFFVSTTLMEEMEKPTASEYFYIPIVLGSLTYALFVAYLIGYLIICMGFEGLVKYKIIQKAYNVQEYLDELNSSGVKN